MKYKNTFCIFEIKGILIITYEREPYRNLLQSYIFIVCSQSKYLKQTTLSAVTAKCLIGKPF